MADQGAEGLLSPFLRNRRCKAAKPFLYGNIMDVGCGTGVLAKWVSPENYLGVDTDSTSLAIAKSKNPKHSFRQDMPNQNRKFDTIVALAVIEHVKSPVDFLIDCSKHLKPLPTSKIIVTTPHPSMEHIHYIGSCIGLFSKHANEEHEELLDQKSLVLISAAANLEVINYRRFLFKGNQIAVLAKSNIKL